MLKSKISSSLCKKRRITFLKKVGVISIFVLFLFSIFVLLLSTEKIRIKNISVVGNSSVSTEEIIKLVQKELDEKYLWIIFTNNIFLLQRSEISEKVLENFKKIKDITLDLDGFNNLKIIVSERVSESLWCLDNIKISEDCYFMDDFGFIFTKAPNFTNNLLIKYYGAIFDEDPIGKTYLPLDKFKEIQNFISEISKIGFKPESFQIINEKQYEVFLLGKAKIIFDDKESVLKNISKLNTLIENNYIEINDDFVSKINHIDLRYGDKVHYDFK